MMQDQHDNGHPFNMGGFLPAKKYRLSCLHCVFRGAQDFPEISSSLAEL